MAYNFVQSTGKVNGKRQYGEKFNKVAKRA